MVRLTRCQPYFVQLMGYELVDWLNDPQRCRRGNWKTAALEDVAHAANEAIEKGRPYFANLWDDAGDKGRQVLSLVAQSDGGTPEEQLRREVALDEPARKETMGRLERYQLVEQVEGY